MCKHKLVSNEHEKQWKKYYFTQPLSIFEFVFWYLSFFKVRFTYEIVFKLWIMYSIPRRLVRVQLHTHTECLPLQLRRKVFFKKSNNLFLLILNIRFIWRYEFGHKYFIYLKFFLNSTPNYLYACSSIKINKWGWK